MRAREETEKTFEERVWDTHPRLRRRQMTDENFKWTDRQNSLAIKYRHCFDVGFGAVRSTDHAVRCGDHAQEDLTRVVQARPLCRIRRRRWLGSPHGTARKFYKSQDTRHASMRTLGIACSPDVQQKWTEDRKYDPRLEDIREN
ncbi:unnamed protein product [Musa hybrid cultivar]